MNKTRAEDEIRNTIAANRYDLSAVTAEEAATLAKEISCIGQFEIRQTCFWEAAARRLAAYISSEQQQGGWTKWAGGKQPVGDEVLLEVILKNGMRYQEYSDEIRWSASNDRDVERYRVVPA